MISETPFKYFVLDVNPEPWRVGPVTTGRKGNRIFGTVGRDQQLHAYKEAIKEALGTGHNLIVGRVELQFWFWRARAEYKTHQARTVRKHEADGTNMAKATEDALQGVLFKNDKDTNRLTWTIVKQSADVHGKVVVGIRPGVPDHLLLDGLPSEILGELDELDAVGGPELWLGPGMDEEEREEFHRGGGL